VHIPSAANQSNAFKVIPQTWNFSADTAWFVTLPHERGAGARHQSFNPPTKFHPFHLMQPTAIDDVCNQLLYL
jgi:hypothetical protein